MNLQDANCLIITSFSREVVANIAIVYIDQIRFNIRFHLERAKLLSTSVKTSNMFFKRIFVQKLFLTVQVIISTKDIILVQRCIYEPCAELIYQCCIIKDINITNKILALIRANFSDTGEIVVDNNILSKVLVHLSILTFSLNIPFLRNFANFI